MFFSVLRIVLLLVLLTSSTLVGATHPRLYFSESDLPQLRQAARSSKKIQFNRLQAWGDANLGQKPPEKIGTVERHHETALSAITAFGFLYQIKEQEKYLSAGRRWLDALLATPTESGGNYHIGVFAASLAHGYDLFYNGLDEHFRRQLMVKTIDVLKEARYGADHHWWGGIYTHHDFWIPVAGMGIAALCLGDEYKDADTLLSYCVGELGRAMELLGTQGYWPEGVADWVYLLSTPLMFFDALNRVGGKDFYLYDWMKNTARVRAYHWMPDDSYMFVGDSYRSGRYGTLGSVSAHVIMRLAARYRDPVAQWLALREAHVDSSAGRDLSLQAPYAFGDMRPLDSRQVHGLPWQFLWYDPTLRPEPPAKLPHDIKFSNWGSALLRSGWSDRNPVLFFAGGHMLGRLGTEAWQTNPRLRGGLAHTHQNAGALYWWADGNFLLCPPSYGGRDGRFHSTVMIDGHGQLYEPGHRVDIEHFESGHGWSYVSMELAGAYPGEVGLDRFHRQVVYLKPRTVVLCDRLTTHGGAKKYIRRYEWLLHTDAGIGEWQAGGDTIAVVHRDTGEKLLTGKIFPSTRYFFERQSMDRPDGRPMVRALSTTFIGRLPVEVEIAAVLHAPARDEDKTYSKVVMWVAKANDVGLKMDFYDEDKELWK
ncbi:MAG: DUF4962 domain-containing protein, partial [Gemmatimonadota bacterium]|nr:DUF4962 domain-containing protein [Gemmatimonadota bacterium]